MSARADIDVSGLPEFAFGHRDPMFWGVAGLIAIESTMLVLLAATYLYLRGSFPSWPPAGFGAPVQALAAIEVLVLLASVVPTHLQNAAARRGDLRAVRRWLVVALAMGAAFVALRAVELRWLPYRWDLNAYTSTVWCLLGLNLLHATTGVLENAVMAALTILGPVEKKHMVDVELGGLLWYFVIASWTPLYVLLYLAPRLLST